MFCRDAAAASTVSGGGPATGFLPQAAKAGSPTAAASVNSVAFKGTAENVIRGMSLLTDPFMV